MRADRNISPPSASRSRVQPSAEGLATNPYPGAPVAPFLSTLIVMRKTFEAYGTSDMTRPSRSRTSAPPWAFARAATKRSIDKALNTPIKSFVLFIGIPHQWLYLRFLSGLPEVNTLVQQRTRALAGVAAKGATLSRTLSALPWNVARLIAAARRRIPASALSSRSESPA